MYLFLCSVFLGGLLLLNIQNAVHGQSGTIQVRLVGGNINSTEGRVEVRLDDTAWGTVCHEYWGEPDAKVVCRQLGLPHGSPAALGYAFFGQGSGSIWLYHVGCVGHEARLDMCNHPRWGFTHNCGHQKDAGVICIDGASEYRLVGGSNANEGRVEVRLGSTWGTVCHDGWGTANAKVLCRQLGLPHGFPVALGYGYFEWGSGAIWMDEVTCVGTEAILDQCSRSAWGVHNCAHSKDVSVICTDEAPGLRLVVGSNITEGRVEIRLGSAWGTICHDLWDQNDARVVCRQLGLPYGSPIPISSAFYGQGTGYIFMDDVECTGSESSLSQCPHRGWAIHNCIHQKDAGVICTDELPEFRLVGGGNITEGRVEIRLGSEWGTVCHDHWDVNDARVLCRQLGFPHGSPVPTYSAFFGQGTGNIFMDDVGCLGSESSLLQCPHRGWTSHDCVNQNDAGVICTDETIDIRLVDGDSATEGRVEVRLTSDWGTVCHDSWGVNDASIVCRQLGFPYGSPIHLLNAFFGQGSGTIFMDDIGCTGSESILSECSHRGWAVHDCVHQHDAGVICTDDVPDLRLVGGSNIREGRVEIRLGSEWGTVCHDNWGVNDAKAVCRQLGLPYGSPVPMTNAFFGQGSGNIFMDDVGCTGSESVLSQCTHRGWAIHDCVHQTDAGVICTDDPPDVRLVGGSNITEGRVEIRLSSEWGTVCYDNWGANDARIVCRQLGLPYGSPIAISNAFFGQGSGYIFMDDLGCIGSESSLSQCSHRGWAVHNCVHQKDAGVICTDDSLDVRLVGGGSAAEGRVEIRLSSEWGTVCHTYWDVNDARVVCRQLGLLHGSPIPISSAFFGQGTGQIWMDNVACVGSETSLDKCGHRGWGVNTYNCGHQNDAGVICSNGMSEVRLVGGSNSREGRLEVRVGSVWGTVCQDNFGAADAQVACRQLGLPHLSATVLTGAYFGQGTGTIWLSNVFCSGHESSLAECSHSGWMNHRCGHTKDVSVSCTNGDITTMASPVLTTTPSPEEIQACRNPRSAYAYFCDAEIVATSLPLSPRISTSDHLTTKPTRTTTTASIDSIPLVYPTITTSTEINDGSVQTERPERVELTCTGHGMTVLVPRSIIGGVSANEVHFNDPSCMGTYYNSTHLRLQTAFNQCETVMQVTDEYVVFSNTVINDVESDPHDIISRDHSVKIPVQCHIDRDGSGSVSFDPDTSKIIIREEGYGNFSFHLHLYMDTEFGTPYGPSSYPIDVVVGDMIYFEARVSAQPGLELFVETCVATPTASPSSTPQYFILQNGCALDDTLQFFNDTDDAMTQRFGIEAFAFSGLNSQVFIHCSLLLCNTTDQSSRCDIGCVSSDKKRDVNNVGTGSGSKSYMMTKGPLNVIPNMANESDSQYQTNLVVYIVGGILAFVILTSAMVVVGVFLKIKQKTSNGEVSNS